MRTIDSLLVFGATVIVFAFIGVCPAICQSSLKNSSIRLLFCGDLMPHKGVKRSAMAANRKDSKGNSLNHGGFYRTLRDLRSLTKQADISFCNLETPIVKPPRGDPYCFATRGDFYFKAPPVLIDAIKWAGFSVLSIANNHIDNAGESGIISTIDYLNKKKITVVGAGKTYAQAHSPAIVSVGGVKVAYLAYCSSRLGSNPNSKNSEKVHVCRVDPRDASTKVLFEDISYAKSVADIVILSFHWGPYEYKFSPSKSAVKLAKECAERGVSVIAGHHPHVLQKVEHYKCKDGRKSFIMWSLGNLISNQSPKYNVQAPGKDENAARRREGAAVMVTLQPSAGIDGSKTHYDVANVAFAPLWTDNNFHLYSKGLEEADVRIVAVDSEIKRLQKRILFLIERRKRVVSALQGKLEEYQEMQKSPKIASN